MIIDNFQIDRPYDIYLARVKIDEVCATRHMKSELKPIDCVWDENWTVKANREYTAQYNDTLKKSIEQQDADKRANNLALEKAVIKYIVEALQYDDITIDDERAAFLWSWCHAVHDWEDYAYLDDAIELASKLLPKNR